MKPLAVSSAVASLLCGAASAPAGGPRFSPAAGSPVEVGPGSGGVFLVDVNRDGRLDLVAKHLLGKRLSVRLGDGRGGFAPAPGDPVRFDYEPGNVALADVNGDGAADLGVMRRDERREYLHVFLGTGDGRFKEVSDSPVVLATSIQTYKPALAFADLDRDGKPDVVTANGRRNSVEVLLGDGRGGFRPGKALALDAGWDRHTFAVGDVDGDGGIDLVTSSSALSGSPTQIDLWRGNPGGTFERVAPSRTSAPPDARVVRLTDANADARPDLVLVHGTALTLLPNDGRGNFSRTPRSTLHLGVPAFDVLVADADGDGDADLVVATVEGAKPFESRVMVLLGDGGGFTPAPDGACRAEPGAYNLAAGDVNGDGKLDVVASSFEGTGVTVLLAR